MWKKITTHKFWSFGIGLLLLGSLSAGIWNIYFNKPVAVEPKITEVSAKLGIVAVSIENDGAITAEKAVVNFSQSGTLDTLNVKIGDKVVAGDILAALDTSKLTAQINQAQATYSANLEKATRLSSGGVEVNLKQIAVDSAKIALTTERAIYDDVVSKFGVGSTQELTEVAKLRKAEADVATAESQLAVTRASYNDAKFQANASYAGLVATQASLYDTQIISPINGIVTGLNGMVGQTVGGSQTTQSGFITITNPDSILLVSKFDEEDIVKIKEGQAIKAEFLSLNTTLDGSVVYISPAAIVDQNGIVSYEVHSRLVTNEHRVLDGMSATVRFITKQVDDVITVPNKAVKRVDGQSVVSYYDEQNKIVTKPVITGFTDGKSVAITKGLGVGDQYLIIQ
ncbi:biotin/lipoyl-binding protein [Candidatus Saccharibacteria bacterium]|nr:biotin/lipoyl-binding protein [Candidatus Saccharibacteria bacterium]